MSTDISNYDVFESILANDRKARKWTLYWIIALCILATVVIFFAIANSKQKKTIADLSMSADYKTKVIDSLKSVIQKEVDKKVDSLTGFITELDKNIQKIEKDAADPAATGGEEKALQKENFKNVNNSIRELNNTVRQIKTDFKKERLRYFIQYNNKEESRRVAELAAYLKTNDNNFVAPPELLNSSFDNVIKIYNYDNEKEEMNLKGIIGKIFNMPQRNIEVKHVSSNANVTKPTIEVWIGTQDAAVQQMSPAKKN
ncbi:MAG TPA: hypothetical protein VK489_11430 [Ferruginibacter sp.]|nr:hypothetical protein [Ferruginibacter sp.]